MISNNGNSNRHVSCLSSEWKAIKPIYHVKLATEYAFSLRVPGNIKNRLAGSGGDSRTGPAPVACHPADSIFFCRTLLS